MLPQVDAREGEYLGHDPGAIRVSVRAWIHYRDGEGQESQRNIITQLLAPHGPDEFAFNAFCEGREERRTFLASRVVQFVDRETGETVDDVVDFLQEAYANSPIGILDQVIETHWLELQALVFMARAGDAPRAAQWAPLLRFVRSQAMGVAWSDGELTRRLAGIKVSSRDYRDALRQLATAPNRVATWLECLEEVAASRGDEDWETSPALVTARKALAK